MSELFIYLLKANFALTLFYIGYQVGLRNLTFYKLNRYYLLFAFTFSSIYPLFDWSQLLKVENEISVEFITVVPNWHEFQLANDETGWNKIVEIVFWFGLALFFIRLLIKLAGIFRIHFKSVPARWSIYPYRRSKEDIVPFSFWKNIYLNSNKYNDDELEKIFRHEYVHVCQLHSLDILIAEITLTLFWFNPICWILRKCVRENIEFIADQKVISSGVDKRNYQYSLLNISTQANQVTLGNQFNFHNLKKRIMMMNKKQSANTHLGKYVFVLSAILIGSFIFGVTKATDGGAIFQKSVLKANPLNQQDTLNKDKQPLIVIDGVTQEPGFNPKIINPSEIEQINVHKDSATIASYGEKGKNGVISITSKTETPLDLENGADTLINALEVRQGKSSLDSALIYIDGVKVEKKTLEEFDTDDIESITVFKGEKAIERYGDVAKGGAIEITTKPSNN